MICGLLHWLLLLSNAYLVHLHVFSWLAIAFLFSMEFCSFVWLYQFLQSRLKDILVVSTFVRHEGTVNVTCGFLCARKFSCHWVKLKYIVGSYGKGMFIVL